MDEPRLCSCGHPVSHHSFETETVRYLGLFDPSVAGKVVVISWVECLDPEAEADSCAATEHSWDAP